MLSCVRKKRRRAREYAVEVGWWSVICERARDFFSLANQVTKKQSLEISIELPRFRSGPKIKRLQSCLWQHVNPCICSNCTSSVISLYSRGLGFLAAVPSDIFWDSLKFSFTDYLNMGVENGI
jgi:hypothetical protein